MKWTTDSDQKVTHTISPSCLCQDVKHKHDYMNTILLSQELTNILWKEAFFGTDTVRYRFSFKALSPSYTWKTSTKIHIITVTGKLKICSNRYTVTLEVHFNITYSAMNRCKLIIYFNIFMKFNIVVLKLAKLLCIISERWNRKFGIHVFSI